MPTTIWIIRRLLSDILAHRRKASLKSLIARFVRSLRVLAYLPEHKKFLQLDVVRLHLADKWNIDLFHHLSQRSYLCEDLPVRTRIAYWFAHYRLEDRTFIPRYKTTLYRKGGFLLWEREVAGKRFAITLTLSPRWAPEGELSICLLMNGKTLHCLSFNWIDGTFAGLGQPIVPLVARNQGASSHVQDALAAFNQAFPNNSPSFFCFAAMQGIAEAVHSNYVVAIKGDANICYENKGKASNFTNAYDKFWKSLGGVEVANGKYLISLPFYTKPLEEISAKHRKRASIRRSFWKDISSSSCKTIQPYTFHKCNTLIAA
ncbi:DUF535 family protein [Noviherbaspirillum sp. 1P10PC]|uniref:DUF535 family protein n=1 Tax=Noviherbaspirillum sp. 1P10PC TaxID=3132292 RepID=UPI0039A06DA3